MKTSLSTRPNHDNIGRAGPGTRRRLLISSAAVALLATFLFGTLPYSELPYRNWDLGVYRAMAAASPSIATEVQRPFAYRVLGPWLAGLLPVEDAVAFRILTSAVLVLTTVAFAAFLIRRGVSTRGALAAVIAFAFNKHMFGYPAWNPFQIGDALGLLELLVLFECFLSRRFLAFALVFLLGALTRETVILAVPSAAVFLSIGPDARLRTRDGRFSDLGRLGLALLPGLFIFAALRLWLPATGYMTLDESFMRHAHKLQSANIWLRLTLYAVVPVSFFPLIFARTTLEFFRRRPFTVVLLPAVLASTLFASNNERLTAPAFIVFYWLIATIVDAHLISRRASALLIGLVVVASTDHMYARFRLPDERATLALAALAVGLATLVGIAVRAAERRHGASESTPSAFK